MVNLVASTLANAVVTNNLNPEDELEVIRHQLDELYVKYLAAYRTQHA